MVESRDNKILEFRFHGRAGQGAKTMAQILALAAMAKGKHIQTFPEYGPERGGAPMQAFTRISEQPIRLHSQVTNPDVVVVIDPSLLDSEDVCEGLEPGGVLLVNSQYSPSKIKEKLKNDKNYKVATVDATRISLEEIGQFTPNTPMLGALAKVNKIVSLEDLKQHIYKKFLSKLGEQLTQKNINAIQKAYEEVKIE